MEPAKTLLRSVMAVALCCLLHQQLPATEAALRAGAAKTDITPKLGVSLDGPISKNGPVKGVHDRLHARALVFDDGTTRLAIVVCDACIIGRDVFDSAKSIVNTATGLPIDRMLIAATHTHAAPRTIHVSTEPIDNKYHEWLAQQIAAAVIQAQKNLAPAEAGWGSFDKPEFIRCRRHLCKPGSVGPNPFGETGERVKSVAGNSSAVIEPAGPVDPQFSILSVQHADGTPLAVLGNFSVHYCGGYRRGVVSADYFGHFAEELERQLDAGQNRPPFVGIMSNGTSGNTGAIEKGGKKYAPFEWLMASGRILAEDALRVVRTIEHNSNLSIAMCESELELAVRLPSESRLKWAREIMDNPQAPHPHRWTPIYAQQTLLLSQFPKTVRLKIQAVRIGKLGIVALPCEAFAETGLAIKQESPCEATFTIDLANGYHGYLPPPEQHELGGYETWPACSSCLEVEAEPRIRTEALRLLRNTKGVERQ